MSLRARHRRLSVTPAAITLVIGFLGCQADPPPSGPPMLPVTGTIIVDEEPAAGATVRFVAVDAPGASAPAFVTGSDGRFTAATPGSDVGVAAGTYRLVVYWLATPPGGGMPVDRLFGRYADPDRASLTVTIDPNDPDIGTFTLTSGPSR